MNKNTGTEFLKIAAFLYSMRYIAAAIYMGPGSKSWSSELFNHSYTYVGNGLTKWAAGFAIAGVILIIGSMIRNRNKDA